MEQFQQVIYSDTITTANIKFNELVKSIEVKYPNAKKHFDFMWKRRDEWCFSYRDNIITRGNNTNNYCEASIRIFKDVVLQRCKAFNSCALVDFICNVFDSYHKRRLLEFANSRKDQQLQAHYSKFLKKKESTEIMRRSEHEFKVTSVNQTDVYTVNTKWETCDCIYGRGGRYCKHMCAVEVKYAIQMSSRPLLSVEEKVKLAKLALGNSVSTEFFKSMELNYTDDSDIIQNDVSSDVNNHLEIKSNYGLTCPPPEDAKANDLRSSTNCLRSELNRIVDLIEINPNIVDVNILNKSVSKIKGIKTPAQVMSFLREKLILMKTKKIRVQPTSISRRKNRGISKGGSKRIQSGRPAANEGREKLLVKKRSRGKRQHNLALSVKNNEPNAKLH